MWSPRGAEALLYAEYLLEMHVCYVCTCNFFDLIETPFNGHLMSPESLMTLIEHKLKWALWLMVMQPLGRLS